MDKLRALQYCETAARTGSFAAAARAMGVSPPAVQKLVSAFERSLGAALFDRTSQGLTLTSRGATYLEQCAPLLAGLASADEGLRESARRPSGALVVGAHAQLATHVLLPVLSGFHARYPDIQIDLRIVHRLSDDDTADSDVLLLQGWPSAGDLIHRPMGMARVQVVASPEYWAAHGVPTHPSELAGHDCLLLRNPDSILLDLWEFERGDEVVAVKASGWLSSNSREILLAKVLAGEGCARFNVVNSRPYLQSGQLVPVLRDWEMRGGAPVNLLWRPNVRRLPCARVFVDYMMARLRELGDDPATMAVRPYAERPHWHRRGASRASSALAQRAPD